MQMIRATLAALLFATLPVGAEPDRADLLAAQTYPFRIDTAGTMDGPGAAHLRRETADAQFVLFGEAHHDRDSPRLALAIYRMLQAAHGFEAAVLELDPLAVEASMQAPLRGDVKRIAELARRYPSHVGFASDQDLAFLAEATTLGRVWGVEQAQGATRYLEELATLDTSPAIAAKLEALHRESAARETRANQGAILHDDPLMLERFEALAAEFDAAEGSRADRLFDELIDSARIYSYNRRGMAGEHVFLLNNSEREARFKRLFAGHYRELAREGRLPRAMFKFGGWHTYRGKSPAQAYTIGNFAHELAMFNGMKAYGISVLPLGGHGTWADVPAWMRPLLPSDPPKTPVLIDLRPLHPYVRLFRETVEPAEQWQLRDFLLGFDALVILPDSAKASWELTGFDPP